MLSILEDSTCRKHPSILTHDTSSSPWTMEDPNTFLCSFGFWCFSNSGLGNLQEAEVAEETTVQGRNENNVEYDPWWYSCYTTKGCKSIGKKYPLI